MAAMTNAERQRRYRQRHRMMPRSATMPEIVIPPHKASFSITHNEHKNYYSPISREIEERPDWYDDESWVSVEEKAKAIATDEVWTAQWYPETPVGSYTLHASTLEALNEGLRQFMAASD